MSDFSYSLPFSNEKFLNGIIIMLVIVEEAMLLQLTLHFM